MTAINTASESSNMFLLLFLFFTFNQKRCSHSAVVIHCDQLYFAAFHDALLLLMKLNTPCRCLTVNVTWKDYFSSTAARLLMWNRWRNESALTANSRWGYIRGFLPKYNQKHIKVRINKCLSVIMCPSQINAWLFLQISWIGTRLILNSQCNVWTCWPNLSSIKWTNWLFSLKKLCWRSPLHVLSGVTISP